MRLIFFGILLILPAFFSAGEVALLRLRPIRVQRLVEEERKGAQSINRLQRRLRRALMVSQLGVSISLVALGWLGRGMSTRLWPETGIASQLLNASLFLIIVFFTTLIAGLVPKAIVLNRPEAAALELAPILEAAMKVIAPILAFFEVIASALLKLVGLNTHWDSLVPALSAEELETLIDSGGVTGLRPDERNILEGVFALRDTQVREVMVPRSGMVTLPMDIRFSELMKAVHETRHARFPVIGESLDDVLGVIDLRELAEPIAKGFMQADTALSPYLLNAQKVPETSTLSELLMLIRSGNPLLLVVDEHGGTEGLVTAADLTGEIVGDDMQPNNEVPELEPIDGSPGTWMVAGNLEIIELNRQLSLDLPEANDHHTLAGFLLEKLQHVPIKGESLLHNGIKFEIIKMHGPRIERVKLMSTKNLYEKD